MAPPRIPPQIRFWEKVQKTEHCWFWTGGKRGCYGTLSFGHADSIGAHRYSYQLHYGPIPFGVDVLHRCDNPLCVNPGHLFLGKDQDNVDDAIQKGRRCSIGEKNPRAKLTELQVREILSLRGKLEQKTIAAMFGVATTTICDIMKMRHWAHLQKAAPPEIR